MTKYLSLAEVKQLKTGDRVRVTWSGGNGPHEYEIFCRADLSVCCLSLDKHRLIVDVIYHPARDRWVQQMIHKVELINGG